MRASCRHYGSFSRERWARVRVRSRRRGEEGDPSGAEVVSVGWRGAAGRRPAALRSVPCCARGSLTAVPTAAHLRRSASLQAERGAVGARRAGSAASSCPRPRPLGAGRGARREARHCTARHGTAGLCSRSALLCFAVSRRELLAPPAPCPSSGCSRRAGGGGCCVEPIRTKLEQKVVFCSRETGRSWLLTVSAAPVLPAPRLK